MYKLIIILTVILTLAGCETKDPKGFAGGGKPDPWITAGPPAGQSGGDIIVGTGPSPVEHSFAIAHLATLQEQSFRENREYCGFFVVDPSDQVRATQAVGGTPASCSNPWPRPPLVIHASYHTHGRYLPRYANEVPSPADMRGDFEAGMDGYVSTPGGRVWFVDHEAGIARLLCERCVPVDPGYNPADDGPIQPTYTLAEMMAR